MDRGNPGQSRDLTIDYTRTGAGTGSSSDPVLQDGDSIIVPELPRQSYWIAGEIGQPGEYRIYAGTRVTVALAVTRAGGVTEMGSYKVKLARRLPGGETQVLVIDIGDVLKKGELDQDVPVQPGDLVIVPRRLF
jgi:polysaccharide export outer membrane protein